jgi:integrase
LAAEAYATKMEERQQAAGRRVLRDTRSRFQRHLFGDDLAGQTLLGLNSGHLRRWRDRLREKELSPASQQRCCNDLRAALNEVARENAATLPERFPLEIRDGFAASTADRVATATRPNVVLSDADVRRVVAASKQIDDEDGWEGDLTVLVIALAATGARFSQIARCRVIDVQFDTMRLMVPVSRKGRGVKAASHTAVSIGADVIAALRPLVVRRRGHEVLFQRWGYRRTGRLQWEKDARRPWEAAEISEPFRKIVERAELSADVTAYALRHSSIVRGLRKRLPVRLVAALHDTSSEMIEKHYSAHIVDAMTDAARLAVVSLVEDSNVVALRAV